MNKFTAFLILVFISSCYYAYADIRISGAGYNETSFINDDGVIRYGNRSDLQLRFTSLSEGAKLVTELNFYTLYGYLASITTGLDDSQLSGIASQITGDELGATTSKLLKNGQFYVDRLYLKFPISKADVILGKQRIAWGSATVFRPTDRFNRPNPLSISGRREGVNALLVTVFTGDLSFIDFVFAPADVFKRIDGEINLEKLEYSKLASRFMFNVFETDMALSYQYDGGSKNHICGLDVKGDLKVGYHLETVFIYHRDEFESGSIEDYWQVVLGADYSFSGKWFLSAEYIYNGPGIDEETELSKSSFSLLDKFQYEHYLYSQISYQHDIFLGASIFTLWNMVDKSFVASPGLKYSLFQNTDLDLRSQIFMGDDTDEYGSGRLGLDQIYYVRLTVKF
jgi:hypothetical protein